MGVGLLQKVAQEAQVWFRTATGRPGGIIRISGDQVYE